MYRLDWRRNGRGRLSSGGTVPLTSGLKRGLGLVVLEIQGDRKVELRGNGRVGDHEGVGIGRDL